MTSDTAFPCQADTHQQPLMQKKSNSIWKIIFVLLFFINVIFSGPLILDLLSSGGNIGLGLIGVILYGFILSAINFIPLLLYIITQAPEGISKVISYTVFTVISLVLVYFGFSVINTFIPGGENAIVNIKLYFIKIGIMQ